MCINNDYVIFYILGRIDFDAFFLLAQKITVK